MNRRQKERDRVRKRQKRHEYGQVTTDTIDNHTTQVKYITVNKKSSLNCLVLAQTRTVN